ncbi:phospholipase D-like domain-containing protein [Massilia endophytica]|uniref:hypothetical protein n=1 Tax=Massilia endophytica TaxID=2899220 RepID=UPI001E503DFA|nr:hypothetical protein [Massilia endophytica]UGQ46386.1 hypothetical protein LSQ66_21900 [Massilia endophytica]
MVDSREALCSIDNTRSQFGGSRYRVISATGASGGIFHPKLAYLETTGGDILVVGSGNLTAAGQGGQLEVLDAVSATAEPEVFEEFSQFLEEVAVVANLAEGAERRAVSYFSKRALTQSRINVRNAGSARTAFLVSSLGNPAGEKLIGLVKRFVPAPETLTVLSPYHDKDANATRQLQRKIGAKSLQYALGKRAKGEFLAPFAKNIKPDASTHFVTPKLNGDDRPLHAKWFDVCNHASASVSMTGSVNATYRSLWRTVNIELAIARVNMEARAEIWKHAKGKVVYEPCEFPAPLASMEAILCKASLSAGYELEIELAPRPAATPLHVRLFQGQTTLFEEGDIPNTDGALKLWLNGSIKKLVKDGAIWVEVSGTNAGGNPFLCYSWVNVEDELKYRPSEVDVEKAVGRLEREDGAYDPEDEYLVLTAVHSALTGRQLKKSGGTRGAAKESAADADIEMTRSELEENHHSRSNANGYAGNSRLTRMLLALSKSIREAEDGTEATEDEEEPISTEEEEHESAAEDGVPAETQAERRNRKQKADARERARLARQSLEAAIGKALKSALPDAKARWLLPYLLGLQLRRHFPERPSAAAADGANAGTILVQALQRHAGAQLTQASKHELLPAFACVGAAACLAFSRHGSIPSYPTVLNILEEFVGRTVNVAELQGFHAQDFPGRGYLILKAFSWSELLPELQKIAQAPRLADRIDDLLRYGMGALQSPPGAMTHAETDFVAGLRIAPGARFKKYSIVQELDPSDIHSPGCPQCHVALSKQQGSRLREKHIAVCEAICRRPIVARTRFTALHEFHEQCHAFIAPRKQGGDQ